ncbi:MAG: hypothetical protein ACQKBW_11635 [Puniceicoccales bacterium]
MSLLLAAASFTCSAGYGGEQLLHNGSFEKGRDGWYLFVPSSSAQSECEYSISHDGPENRPSIAMSSASFARYAFSSTEAIAVQEGKRYRISAWIKTEPGMAVKPDTPGLVIRVLCKNADGQDAKLGQHLYIGLGNKVELSVGPPAQIETTQMPEEWTQIDAVVQFPPQTHLINIQLTSAQTQGTVCWSHVTFEEAAPQTPLTPVLGKKKER